MIIIVMGVSGSGKSTIGKLLSEYTGIPFYDGDEFHPIENVTKMESGIPLTDQDRYPWLGRLKEKFIFLNHKNEDGIFAISALKLAYRMFVQSDEFSIHWVYLRGDYDLIYNRMEKRDDHFMGSNMLKSQFEDLEEPQYALTIPINEPPISIVSQIIEHYRLPKK